MIPKYNKIVRKPSALQILNPLSQTVGNITDVAARLNNLSANVSWAALIRKMHKENKSFNPVMPRCKMVKIGDFKLDTDIQRELDQNHCVSIAKKYHPHLAQSISATKVPGKEEYHSTDGQHTLVTTAGLVAAGFFGKGLNWKEFEVACTYIETDNKAFARKAFKIINGKGKKALGRYDAHRSEVLSARIDKSQEPDDLLALQKQNIMEKHLCFPVPNSLTGRPGAISHLSGALSLNLDSLDFACSWHNKFFHYEPTSGGTWYMFANIKNLFDAANIPLDDVFQDELAGIIQQLFADPAEFNKQAEVAHRAWGMAKYGFIMKWEHMVLGNLLIQVYKALGGKHEIPGILLENYKDLYKHLIPEVTVNFMQEV